MPHKFQLKCKLPATILILAMRQNSLPAKLLRKLSDVKPFGSTQDKLRRKHNSEVPRAEMQVATWIFPTANAGETNSYVLLQRQSKDENSKKPHRRMVTEQRLMATLQMTMK